MKKITIISGHRSLDESLVNEIVLDEVAKALPELAIRRLDELYPDYKIDVQAEQNALQDTDIIVLQFPFFWFGMPALLKKWVDDVFLRGFSHGANATLNGRALMVSCTTGIDDAGYQVDGLMKRPLADFLTPFEGIATFCKMDYLPPMTLTGVSYTHRATDEDKAHQVQSAKDYAKALTERLKELMG